MIALSPTQPYPGLRPFDFGDEEYFFGRDAQIRGLRQKLSSSRLIAVVGRSGCGKSSLVRAGLIPLLRAVNDASEVRSWRIAMFRPQGRPIKELMAELLRLKSEAGLGTADPGGHALRESRMDAMLRRDSFGLVDAARELGLPESDGLLIIVDQFEEIFRFESAQGSDADEATAFVRLLLAAAGAESPRVSIILTMRLDFLGDCARFQGLPEALSDGQFLVPNLNRAERRAAIEEPAKKCGATMSPAVTQRLLNEIGDDPDRLPVLQHALMRTWQEARGRRDITLKDYENTGGIANAISRHADEVFDKLPSDEHRRIAERMFKAISELSRGRAIRRTPPLSLGEIRGIADAHADSVVDVIEAFRAPECCFLMPPVPAPLDTLTPIDISHESLLRGWAKMGTPQREGWLVEEDKDGKVYRSLVDAGEAFATDETAVLPPTQLRQRKAWRAKANPNAAWAERYGNKFDLVVRLLDESERRQRWQRTKKRAAYAALIIFVLVGLGVYANEVRRRILAEAEVEAAQDKLSEKEQIEGREAAVQAAARQLEIVGLQTQIEQLRQELQARGVQTGPDDIAQQTVQGDPKQINNASSAVTNQDGFVWIGSVQQSNLQTTNGTSVSPTDLRVGAKYNVLNNIYLRQGLPDEDTYAQEPSIGVLSEGTTIEALGQPKSYARPTGHQYWLPVRVIASTSPPTVYFQFATAPRPQAQALSKLLQDMGYKMPGEERVDAAQGKREVRYFYPQDKTAAERLAQDTTKALRTAGYTPGPPIAVLSMVDFKGRKNAPGVVELWLDLSPRGE